MNPHEYAEALCIRAEKQGLCHPTEGMIADMLGDIKFNFDQEKRSLERRNSELTARIAELTKERDDERFVNEDYRKSMANLEAALAEARKDSSRINWLEESNHFEAYPDDGFSQLVFTDFTARLTLRESIDAAMLPATPIPETKGTI